MGNLQLLKQEMEENRSLAQGTDVADYYMFLGYRSHYREPAVVAKGYAIASLFKEHKKYVYENDLIAGSLLGRRVPEGTYSQAELEYASRVVSSYGRNGFHTNFDHFAPDYETILELGVGGMICKIKDSLEKHQKAGSKDKKINFLRSAQITMEAFSEMIFEYGTAAEELFLKNGRGNLLEISRICKKLAKNKPDTFHEAIQLVWLCHLSFCYEKRYAMALGRLDQYLYPFYKKDTEAGILSEERAIDLVSCTLYKIIEFKYMNEENTNLSSSDVVNIAIGGVKRDGSDAVNELSYIILEAVKNCNIPGPNLSARMHANIPERFWDKCLDLIGTGIGYPALMNDEVNIPALFRMGYDIEDCRDYSMVGCIENFMTGKQAPWSDGRFNNPKFLELALNNGKCMMTGVQMGIPTGDVSEFTCMQDYIDALEKQTDFAADEYVALFENENDRYNRERLSQPFLSCFCRDCIERGLDIRDGGAIYPSAHGAACMGIATVADSLAAIEKVVFTDKLVTLKEFSQILENNFEGREDIRQACLQAPKYGNNDEFVDKYARWFVDKNAEIFDRYRTYDGGRYYIGIASNITNIPAGLEVSATPDGRKKGKPLSDAASPMHGLDKNGITAVVNSTSKPDFKKVACGTVLNQKFTPMMFSDCTKRDKLKTLIKIYFQKGGQEMQINCVSRAVLEDASVHPENYSDLVVRVSGFSAFYTKLDADVQKDILERTENE